MMKQIFSSKIVEQRVFIILTMLLTLGCALLDAYIDAGYWSAFCLAIGMYCILTTYAIIAKDTLLKHMLVLGIVAGITELLADKYLVVDIASLVYPAEEPKLYYSPNYMPFAWAVVLIQVGYLGWMISSRTSLLKAMLLCALIGFVFIPIFEQCAYWAEWWYYKPCKMLLNTPWYIIAAEGIICFFLPAIFAIESRNKYLLAVGLGIAEGLIIYFAYKLTYTIIE
jgi:hypothetical protein